VRNAIWLLAIGLCGFSLPSFAQFDPAKVKPEPEAVASRYADPVVTYQTPGLRPGRTDFASHDEVLAYLNGLAALHPQMSLQLIGKSQQGRDIPLVILASTRGFQKDKPTVLVVGQQHGNEPSGGEAALALTEQLLTVERGLLDNVNVLILPRSNPDGAQNFVRATNSGLDVNRDHLLLQTPEARAMADTALRYGPQVVMDLHEFTVGDRWLAKFAAYAKYDALLQAATVGNMDAGVADLALREFVGSARAALERNQLSTFWYHTSSADAADRVVSMGGVQPDTGRNVYGLRHAISLLIETRGVGIGRAHFARRVHSHVVATLAVLKTAADQGSALVTAVEAAGRMTADQACKGEMVVKAQASPTRETLQFVDATTGADRVETVDWRTAMPFQVMASRTRPCGYWLGPEQTVAVAKLKALGVQVKPVTQDRKAAVETYRVLSETGGQRSDARGAIASSVAIREVTVALDKDTVVLPTGSWYVGLDQSMGGLISAALEPDSQNSYTANHLMEMDHKSLLRVMQFLD